MFPLDPFPEFCLVHARSHSDKNGQNHFEEGYIRPPARLGVEITQNWKKQYHVGKNPDAYGREKPCELVRTSAICRNL